MWHVSSRSGVATLRTAIHLLLTYLLTYLSPVPPPPSLDAAATPSLRHWREGRKSLTAYHSRIATEREHYGLAR